MASHGADLAESAPSSPSAVPTELRYLRPELKGTVPRIGTGEARRAATLKEKVRVLDARALLASGELSLERNGFTLPRHETRCPTFRDPQVIRQVYYPEAEKLVQRLTGAAVVYATNHQVT